MALNCRNRFSLRCCNTNHISLFGEKRVLLLSVLDEQRCKFLVSNIWRRTQTTSLIIVVIHFVVVSHLVAHNHGSRAHVLVLCMCISAGEMKGCVFTLSSQVWVWKTRLQHCFDVPPPVIHVQPVHWSGLRSITDTNLIRARLWITVVFPRCSFSSQQQQLPDRLSRSPAQPCRGFLGHLKLCRSCRATLSGRLLS